MNVLSARWFRGLAIFALLFVLLSLNSNRAIVFMDNQYFEPTYRACVGILGFIAQDVSQLERQIVCNITMVSIAADAERSLATELAADNLKEPPA